MNELFVPDLEHEKDRLLIVEHALGEGGLIDRHLSWVPVDKSPSNDVSAKEYGYAPMRFKGSNDLGQFRPSREPIDYQLVATSALGIAPDTNSSVLAELVSVVDGGWFDSLTAGGVLTENQAGAVKELAYKAFQLDTLTEDNLPAYVSTILGGFQASAARYGIAIPATEDWSRGTWTSEEDAHKMSMNFYGRDINLTNNLIHTAGRNSQMRAGMEIVNSHAIQLFAYVAWQELSTNYAHDRDGQLFGPVGNALLTDIAGDEARHHNLYFGVLKALYDAYPSDVVQTLHSLLMKPEMPGKKGIPNFEHKAMRIHGGGIFGAEQAYMAARKVLSRLKLLEEDMPDGLAGDAYTSLMELRGIYQDEWPQKKRAGKFILGQTIGKRDLIQLRKEWFNSDQAQTAIELATKAA